MKALEKSFKEARLEPEVHKRRIQNGRGKNESLCLRYSSIDGLQHSDRKGSHFINTGLLALWGE